MPGLFLFSETVQAALIDGMSALIGIENRIKSDSGNINHQGIDIEASQAAYVDFGKTPGTIADSSAKRAMLGNAAQAMAGDIQAALTSGQLSAVEVAQLQGVLAGLTGDADLAAKFVGQVKLLGESINDALESPSLDAGTRATLEGLLGEMGIDNAIKIDENIANGYINQINDGYSLIAKFRRMAGLGPYSIDSGNTVALISVDDNMFFGVNSGITEQSKLATREIRNKWLKEVNWTPPKKYAPRHLGQALSLTHAEAHALIRAYESLGKLPEVITMYVDRVTCNICRGELPIILKRLRVKELIIYCGGSTTPVVIKAIE